METTTMLVTSLSPHWLTPARDRVGQDTRLGAHASICALQGSTLPSVGTFAMSIAPTGRKTGVDVVYVVDQQGSASREARPPV